MNSTPKPLIMKCPNAPKGHKKKMFNFTMRPRNLLKPKVCPGAPKKASSSTRVCNHNLSPRKIWF